MRAHRWLSLGGFLLCPLPPLQLLIFCTEKYIVSISRNTGEISPCLFLSPSRGKNLPKCESLASVLACVLWLLPCRYWITEFWIMFKMDTSLASTMEEFQELVKANGEELHRRLIDTTQMWVPCLWKPPPSCNTTQAAQQASVSCCDLCCVPLWPLLCPPVTQEAFRQVQWLYQREKLALYQESREVPGDNAVCGFYLRAGKKVSVKKKSGSKTLIKIYTNPKKLKVQWLLVLLQQPMPGGTLNLQIPKALLKNGSRRRFITYVDICKRHCKRSVQRWKSTQEYFILFLGISYLWDGPSLKKWMPVLISGEERTLVVC